MKDVSNNSPVIINQTFFTGGGEMGMLVRSKDWSKSPLGNPDTWPQSLRTTLSIILRSKFPMFLFWGPDLICFYNDAYRPSLGKEGKHPDMLGGRGEDYWKEAWPVIKPLIDQVLAGGEATWSEDQLIPMYRDGKIENVYWTFSYSPVNDESGKPAGVFVTCNETTEKVITRHKLEESKDQLHFAIEAAELGTWDYNPFTNCFTCNSRLQEWFGLTPSTEIELYHATDAIAQKDRQRVIDAIQESLNYASGGNYTEAFTIIHPVTKSERIVQVKGKAYFNSDKIAYRLNGTLEDVTREIIAQRRLEESEKSLRMMIEQAPVAICVFRSRNHVVEIANERMLELWGKTAMEIINKPLFEVLPEVKGQGLEQLMDTVFTTGEKFEAHERPVNLLRNNHIETTYINFVYEPVKNTEGIITGILAIATDVTMQVLARKKTEESEEQLRIALEGGDLGTFDYYPETETLHWSAKTKEFFGLPPDAEVSYALYLQSIHPEDRNASKSIAQQQAKLLQGGFYELEYRTIGVIDGRIRWIRSKGKVAHNSDGKPIRYTGVTQDITELKLAEEKLREFKFMADNASDPFIVTREDGTFAYLNKMALEKWGYTIAEAKHINGLDVDTVHDPQSFYDIFERALRENLPPFETMHRHKSGATYPVEINMTTITLDGKPHLFAIARDITERKKAEQALKESEEKFRTMAESCDILIGVNDETVNAVYFNHAWEKLTGRPLEDLKNLGWADLLHPDDRQPFLDKFFDAFENKKSYSGEFRILNKDGNYSWLYAKVQVRMHPEGSYAGHISSCIDITERKNSEEEIKKSEEALKQSEQRLRSLVESAPFPIGVYTGREMRIELVNDSILRAWDRTYDVVGKLYAEVLTELTGQGIYEQLDNVFTTGIPFHAINQRIDLIVEGKLQPYYYNYSFTPLYNERGDIYGILNTAANVTELNVAKMKLEESEQKLSLVIEASELGNWEVNFATNEFSYSDKYLEIFGHSKETVLTRNEAALQIHPEDRNTRDNALDVAYKTGILSYGARVVWPDNSIHWTEVKGKIFFTDDHTPKTLIGTIRDVTEEKFYQRELEEREEKFRLLANSMPQLVWIGDAKGNLHYFNEAVFTYSGLSAEDIQNGGWLQIVHPDDREDNIRQWTASIDNGKDFLFEHRFKRYDGEYRWQLSRAIPQKDSNGKIAMWVGSSTDIQKIKEEEKRKDDFLKMVSHELKTPVTSIKGYVQFLLSLLDTEVEKLPILAPVKSSLIRIDLQIVRLTRLIKEILDLSRIDAGKMDLQKSRFNLNELVAETIQDISHSSKTHHIALQDSFACEVTADRDRIGQVLINFITNAIKYSPTANIIDVRVFKTGTNEAAVSIKDFGIGISKENQEKIFDRFYRVEGKREENFAGFGIGLFLANEIIQKHDGWIQVESDIGTGAVFTFAIPLHT